MNSAPVQHEFEIKDGDWRMTGSYDSKDNIVFYYKGRVYRKLTYPSYKIWTVGTCFREYIAEFEREMAAEGREGKGTLK